MGFLKAMKLFFSGTKYRINREILIQYVKESIQFSIENELTFCDEFYLNKGEDTSELHLVILNYDVPCDNQFESEKMLKGIIIFEVKGKSYNPETDEKFYSIEDFIDFKLADYGEWFIMRNDLGEPTSLAGYKI